MPPCIRFRQSRDIISSPLLLVLDTSSIRPFTAQLYSFDGDVSHVELGYAMINTARPQITGASSMIVLSDILATSPDNLAKNRVKMAIESGRRFICL